jgi:hypothetical protein
LDVPAIGFAVSAIARTRRPAALDFGGELTAPCGLRFFDLTVLVAALREDKAFEGAGEELATSFGSRDLLGFDDRVGLLSGFVASLRRNVFARVFRTAERLYVLIFPSRRVNKVSRMTRLKMAARISSDGP